MQTMSREGNKLVHRWDGETLVVEPWGNNSLRVRSAVMREPEDTDYALLPQADTAVTIDIGEEKSEIRNGRLRAVMESKTGSGPARLPFMTGRDGCCFRKRGRAVL